MGLFPISIPSMPFTAANDQQTLINPQKSRSLPLGGSMIVESLINGLYNHAMTIKSSSTEHGDGDNTKQLLTEKQPSINVSKRAKSHYMMQLKQKRYCTCDACSEGVLDSVRFKHDGYWDNSMGMALPPMQWSRCGYPELDHIEDLPDKRLFSLVEVVMFEASEARLYMLGDMVTSTFNKLIVVLNVKPQNEKKFREKWMRIFFREYKVWLNGEMSRLFLKFELSKPCNISLGNALYRLWCHVHDGVSFENVIRRAVFCQSVWYLNRLADDKLAS